MIKAIADVLDTPPLPAPRFADDAARWQAVMQRDRSADGAFYYSVRTTGVYCRPSCPARLARRENIAFHITCEKAEQAGFRACKRCRPTEASQAERHARSIAAACRLIEEAEETPSLNALAAAAGLSPYHFHRLFRQATGVTPKAYAQSHRANRLTAELRAAPSVTTAIYDAGYASSSRFYESSNERLGMTPTTYRKGGIGTRIRFAIGHSALGEVIVAATEKGVCAIALGDTPETLLKNLQDQFPKAELIGDDEAFQATVGRVIAFIEAPGRGLDLPLDIGGTAFQQLVWQALRKIPAGTVASYTDIAQAIGQPTAARAVARACATNVIAVAIPCHRVVRSDGGLSGYRWGVERKQELLKREGVR